MAFFWKCTTCGHATTITSPNHSSKSVDLFCPATPVDAGIKLKGSLIQCPNPECQAQDLRVSAYHGRIINRGTPSPDRVVDEDLQPIGIGEFTFLPTTAQPLSEHAPKGVVADYNEAYLIRVLSPKASATLARRALQGMIRDYWGVRNERTLHAELRAIKDKCAPELFDAMMAVKSIGNIGAHPEQDINAIVDVEVGEPEALLDLIHLLDSEWYVARAESQRRIQKMREIAARKNSNDIAPSA